MITTMTPEDVASMGLTQSEYDAMIDVLKGFTGVNEIWVFGSRAKGTHRPDSNLDLAIMTPEVRYVTRLKLIDALNELRLFFEVSVLHYPSLHHERTIERVNRAARLFYRKG